MNIIMLAAGTSSRMGKTNKMLIPIDGIPMVACCCINALRYLESLNEKSRLIVVTGYRRLSLHKALAPCREFIEKTSSNLEMIEVFNPNFRKGQFSSTKTGVSNVPDCEPFFISLADMPQIRPENYCQISNHKSNADAIRPFSENRPGHPVLLSASMKERILSSPDNLSVSRVLEGCNVEVLIVSGPSWVADIDSPQDIN